MQEQSKGLGDTIQKITKATGVKKVVDKISKITNKDCGCEQRKDTLNRLFPYKNYGGKHRHSISKSISFS